MLKTFFDSDSSSNGIFEWVETEAERRIIVKNFIEELSALFDFKIVGSIHSSFVDGTSGIQFFSFSLTTWYKDIESDDIIDGKLLIVDTLFESLFVENNLISINQMFFELMRKNTF